MNELMRGFQVTPEDLSMIFRLFMATLLGSLIGFEREAHGKDAGVRTHALVCLGSTLIMIVSVEMFEIYKGITEVDPSRIAAQAVSGIGFIGAGAIIRSPQGAQGVKGLTTAAGIWTSCGIGLACGVGLYWAAIVTTVFSLFILVAFSKVDRFFGGRDH